EKYVASGRAGGLAKSLKNKNSIPSVANSDATQTPVAKRKRPPSLSEPEPEPEPEKKDITSARSVSENCRFRQNGASHLPAALVVSPPADFEHFWQEWPHKIGKGAARTAFGLAIKKTTLEIILSGIARYQVAKPRDRPWCNPATWLNQERWLDEEGTPA